MKVSRQGYYKWRSLKADEMKNIISILERVMAGEKFIKIPLIRVLNVEKIKLAEL